MTGYMVKGKDIAVKAKSKWHRAIAVQKDKNS